MQLSLQLFENQTPRYLARTATNYKLPAAKAEGRWFLKSPETCSWLARAWQDISWLRSPKRSWLGHSQHLGAHQATSTAAPPPPVPPFGSCRRLLAGHGTETLQPRKFSSPGLLTLAMRVAQNPPALNISSAKMEKPSLNYPDNEARQKKNKKIKTQKTTRSSSPCTRMSAAGFLRPQVCRGDASRRAVPSQLSPSAAGTRGWDGKL